MNTLDTPIPVTVDAPPVLADLGARPRPALLLASGGGFAKVRYTDQLREIVTAPAWRVHPPEEID